MTINILQSKVAEIFSHADVKIGGARSWDIHLTNDQFYSRVLSQGSLGLGESYMDGHWDVERLDEFICKVVVARLERHAHSIKLLIPVVKSALLNLQTRARASQVAERHYDLGNEFFRHMLDKRLVYTCGYWKVASTLDEAQEAKLNLVCQKIGLKSGMRILDIGCGWGSFAKFAAEVYGAKVVGITVSRNQLEFAREHTQGLPVEIRLQDYREVNEKFDHIVSLGMFEHVGHKNHRTYMQVVSSCLKDEGLFLLHTIGDNITTINTDPWITKYIFPNGDLPSLRQITRAIEELFIVEDMHNFGVDYDKTLMAWFNNFDQAWPALKDEYGERFYRMWKFYLLSCAGAFRARKLQLWQIVLTKTGIIGGYQRIS